MRLQSLAATPGDNPVLECEHQPEAGRHRNLTRKRIVLRRTRISHGVTVVNRVADSKQCQPFHGAPAGDSSLLTRTCPARLQERLISFLDEHGSRHPWRLSQHRPSLTLEHQSRRFAHL